MRLWDLVNIQDGSPRWYSCKVCGNPIFAWFKYADRANTVPEATIAKIDEGVLDIATLHYLKEHRLEYDCIRVKG